MTLKVKCITTDPSMKPTKAHPDDAGFDLRAACHYGLNEHARLVRTGVHVNIPPGYVGLLSVRSSVAMYGVEMANAPGIIDAGYTGEVKLALKADRGYTLFRGERVAQLVIVPTPCVELVETDAFEETERGTGGFGSSGKD